MNEKIESRLERSLRSQLRVPAPDGRFKAAVWARIEQAAVPVVPPVRRGLPRWLIVSNVLGVLVAIALVVIVGTEATRSVEVALPAMPQLPPGLVDRVLSSLAWPITAVVLIGCGLLTNRGRRLRAEWF